MFFHCKAAGTREHSHPVARPSDQGNHNMVELARLTVRIVRDTSGLTRSMGDLNHSLIQADNNTIHTATDMSRGRSDPVVSASSTVQHCRRCANLLMTRFSPLAP